MKLKELAEAILALTPEQQNLPACVFPPEACPAATPVPVTGLEVFDERNAVGLILTGKKPGDPATRQGVPR